MGSHCFAPTLRRIVSAPTGAREASPLHQFLGSLKNNNLCYNKCYAFENKEFHFE